jgi:hypothetical protein
MVFIMYMPVDPAAVNARVVKSMEKEIIEGVDKNGDSGNTEDNKKERI